MKFYLRLIGWTYLMPDATSWAAAFITDTQTFYSSGFLPGDPILFSNVLQTHGQIGVVLNNGTTYTPMIYSTVFSPLDGDLWEYNLYLHGQVGDLTLVSRVSTGEWIVAGSAYDLAVNKQSPLPTGEWVLAGSPFDLAIAKESPLPTGEWVIAGPAYNLAVLKIPALPVGGWVSAGNPFDLAVAKVGEPGTGGVQWAPILIAAGAVAVGAALVAKPGQKKRATKA